MIIETKYFGVVNYDETDIITFHEGLYGFENAKEFLLLAFDKNDDSMMCLQCVNRPEVAFVVFNPIVVDVTYSPTLSIKDRKSIQLASNKDLVLYVIAVVGINFKDTVVNLKCPVAINKTENLAIQAVLEDTKYTFRHPVFRNALGE